MWHVLGMNVVSVQNLTGGLQRLTWGRICRLFSEASDAAGRLTLYIPSVHYFRVQFTGGVS